MNTNLVFLCLSFVLIGFTSIWLILQTTFAQSLMYTNPDLGFILEYPTDWTVNDNIDPATVYLVPPSGPATASVIVSVIPATDVTLEELANSFLESNVDTQYDANLRLTEMNTDNYFLGGHPAIRVVAVGTVGVNEVKAMGLFTIVDGKGYGLISFASPEVYSSNLPTFQRIGDSFQIY